MRDWKALALAMGLEIPEADLDRIVPGLEMLEASFRPLVVTIPRDVEPAIILSEPSVCGK